MPLYEYQCDACGNRFEVIQKFSDARRDICPKCGGAVHKMQSAPAFQLKGTGWYATDYAKKSPDGSDTTGAGKKDAPKDAETSRTKEATSAGSADSKSGGLSDGKTTASDKTPSKTPVKTTDTAQS